MYGIRTLFRTASGLPYRQHYRLGMAMAISCPEGFKCFFNSCPTGGFKNRSITITIYTCQLHFQKLRKKCNRTHPNTRTLKCSEHLWKSYNVFRYGYILFNDLGTPRLKISHIWLEEADKYIHCLIWITESVPVCDLNSLVLQNSDFNPF